MHSKDVMDLKESVHCKTSFACLMVVGWCTMVVFINLSSYMLLIKLYFKSKLRKLRKSQYDYDLPSTVLMDVGIFE